MWAECEIRTVGEKRKRGVGKMNRMGGLLEMGTIGDWEVGIARGWGRAYA